MLLFPLLGQAGVFASDKAASPYDHDRVGKLAGATVLRVCGEVDDVDSRATLQQMTQWQAVEQEAAAGVLIKEYMNFADQPGLTARFRVGKHSCVLTLSPYLANARAGDELAYGVSEAAGKAFGDSANNWQPEQTMSGLHRIDAMGKQYQQTFFLQWQQTQGLPSHSYFAVFDNTPEAPRVLLGKRSFNGQATFGMADSQWRTAVTKTGRPIVSIRGKDPVDPRAGGFNIATVSRLGPNRLSLKAWMPIGSLRQPFRLQTSLGSAPLKGFKQLQLATLKDGQLELKSVPAQVVRKIPGKQGLLNKGLYPVYLKLDKKATNALLQAEYLSLVLTRKGGSEIRLQLPVDATLAQFIRSQSDKKPKP